MAGFGSGLGTFIGAATGAEHLDQGKRDIASTAGGFNAATDPYNTFGQSFLGGAASTIGEVKEKAGEVQSYDDFAKGYTASPGVRYQMEQGLEAQDMSAASRGQLLSGTNVRAREEIAQGIAGKGLNTAYDQYLKGNSQQFGQLETALGNMFGAIGVGTTATGQQASVASSQMSNQAAIAKSQAENDRAKGGGLGDMFGGIGSLAAAF